MATIEKIFEIPSKAGYLVFLTIPVDYYCNVKIEKSNSSHFYTSDHNSFYTTEDFEITNYVSKKNVQTWHSKLKYILREQLQYYLNSPSLRAETSQNQEERVPPPAPTLQTQFNRTNLTYTNKTGQVINISSVYEVAERIVQEENIKMSFNLDFYESEDCCRWNFKYINWKFCEFIFDDNKVKKEATSTWYGKNVYDCTENIYVTKGHHRLSINTYGGVKGDAFFKRDSMEWLPISTIYVDYAILTSRITSHSKLNIPPLIRDFLSRIQPEIQYSMMMKCALLESGASPQEISVIPECPKCKGKESVGERNPRRALSCGSSIRRENKRCAAIFSSTSGELELNLSYFKGILSDIEKHSGMSLIPCSHESIEQDIQYVLYFIQTGARLEGKVDYEQLNEIRKKRKTHCVVISYGENVEISHSSFEEYLRSFTHLRYGTERPYRIVPKDYERCSGLSPSSCKWTYFDTDGSLKTV